MDISSCGTQPANGFAAAANPKGLNNVVLLRTSNLCSTGRHCRGPEQMAQQSRSPCTSHKRARKCRRRPRMRPVCLAGRTRSRRGRGYGLRRRGQPTSQTASCDPARTRAPPLVSRCPTRCPAIQCPMWRRKTDPEAERASPFLATSASGKSARRASTAVICMYGAQARGVIFAGCCEPRDATLRVRRSGCLDFESDRVAVRAVVSNAPCWRWQRASLRA